MLLDAMWETTLPEFATRSTVITGTFAAFAALTAEATASESVGLITTTSTPFELNLQHRSFALLHHFAHQQRSIQCRYLSLSFLHPFSKLQNGLFKVETENPTLIVLFRPLSLESFAHSGVPLNNQQ